MKELQTRNAGLSDFALKYLAMVLMILDHIHYFFEFTGKVPILFTWLGRLSAPLFLFCVIQGFTHTHDRKKYFLRIYLLSAAMGTVMFSFFNLASGLVRPDGFYPQNQMLATFAILLVILQGIDWCKQKKWGQGLCFIIFPIILPYLFAFLFQTVTGTGAFILNLLAFTFLPLHTAIMDGGTFTIIMGIVLYLTNNKPKLQAVCYVITVILIDIVFILTIAPGLTLRSFFFEAYQWMEIFAVIFMLCYNGKKGKGSKKLFYWFYPAHIYVLYFLSFGLYLLLN